MSSLRKTLTFITFSFLSAVGIGQYWAPVGAIWHYDQQDLFSGIYNYISIESIGDTIMIGDTVRTLRETRYLVTNSGNVVSNHSDYYYKFENNSVQYFSFELNDFRQLYDFNAQVGDTIDVFCRNTEFQDDGDVSIRVIVDDITELVVSGDTLLVQHVHQFNYDDPCFIGSTIIERIGCSGFLFPQSTLADPPYGGPLRCYEDSIIGLYQHNTSIACDFLMSIEESSLNSELSVYPTPSNGIIFFEYSGNIDSVVLYNLNGVFIQSWKESNISQIDLSQIRNGPYFLHVSEGSNFYIKKIFKY